MGFYHHYDFNRNYKGQTRIYAIYNTLKFRIKRGHYAGWGNFK